MLYAGWLYAAVLDPSGTFNGLYMTKDFGANWTKVRLPVDPVTGLFASNNETRGDFDPLGAANQAMVLTIDPVNPNIVYLGGSSIIRVDTTTVRDAHNITAFDSSLNDGGTVQTASTGAAVPKFPGGETSVYGLPESPNESHLRAIRRVRRLVIAHARNGAYKQLPGRVWPGRTRRASLCSFLAGSGTRPLPSSRLASSRP